MILVGLTGKKKRGKDTVYQILEKHLTPQVVKREAFADRLKLSALRCFFPNASLRAAQAWSDFLKEDGEVVATIRRKSHDGKEHFDSLGVTGRQFLQNYGTEAHRDMFGYDFWVDQVLPVVRPTYSGYEHANDGILQRRYPGIDVLVVTDVRFPNEAERVRAHNGKIIEIQRPELDEQEANDSHASEQPLPRELVDAIIVNSGTLNDLERLVVKTWEKLYG